MGSKQLNAREIRDVLKAIITFSTFSIFIVKLIKLIAITQRYFSIYRTMKFYW